MHNLLKEGEHKHFAKGKNPLSWLHFRRWLWCHTYVIHPLNICCDAVTFRIGSMEVANIREWRSMAAVMLSVTVRRTHHNLELEQRVFFPQKAMRNFLLFITILDISYTRLKLWILTLLTTLFSLYNKYKTNKYSSVFQKYLGQGMGILRVFLFRRVWEKLTDF